jgi:cephalosporin-C deacetylase-like acetyl esterase
MDYVNSYKVHEEIGDEILSPVSSERDENFVNPGAVTLKFHDGTMKGVYTMKHIFHDRCIDAEYLKILKDKQRVVVIGTFQGGGGMTGRPVEIKWRKEIEELAVPYLPDLSNRKFWPLLRKLAAQDAKEAHNAANDEK